MSDMPLGLSFSPFGQGQNGQDQNRPGGTGGSPTPQDAIKILSLRTPRTVGAASPIPGPLLNAPGGGAFGGSGFGLEQLLALLFGQLDHMLGKERPAITVPLWGSQRLRPQPI